MENDRPGNDAPAAKRAYHDHMGATNDKRVAVGAVGSVLVLLVLFGALFRHTIAERWYLWRLESSEPDERRAAIRALAALRSERAIPLFSKMMLDDEHMSLRRDLLHGLVDIGPMAADTIASLVQALAPPPAASPAPPGGVVTPLGAVNLPPSTAGSSAPPGGAGNQPAPGHFDVVQELVNAGPRAVPALVATAESGFLGGDVEQARRAGISLKGMMEVEGPIAALLRDPDPAVRRRTAYVVGWARIDRAAFVLPLADMLADRASEVRAAAAYAFRSLGDHVRSAVPRLMAAFGDEDEEVSRQAIDALARSGLLGRESVAPLLEILQDATRSERVHRAVVRALGALGPLAGAAVPHLVARLQAARGSLDFELVLALGRIGPGARAAVPVLLETVRREDRLVRLAAVQALGRIAPRDEQVARRLGPWINAEDEELALAVRKALGLGAMGRIPGAPEPAGSKN